MIRKGRPAPQSDSRPESRSVRRARQDADGPHDDDSFYPFESFDAHDHAATGRRSSGAGTAASGSTSAAAGATVSPTAAPVSTEASNSTHTFAPDFTSESDQPPAEPTYSRSRRAPGDPPPAGKDRSANAKRPARSLKGRALGYLSRREYSRAELARKLAPFVEENDNVDALLGILETEGWLSDSRFAESLIHRRSSRMGASRIVNELKQHAVGQTLIEEASAQLRETELARAQGVWRKKFGHIPETPAERAKQARFLAARGFSGATIGKILKGMDEDWAEGGE
ncbi:MAG: recombination regulator RecX [Paraburkholderia sp.]|uniref:recombination regulator RecX n=1 Tax=Paraburkholderia sp. TaxID=1926495 RepID=UPI00121CF6C8|nr:recombination regulator RecX [Paraburkholderia sp.]TAL94892.1 MAG: recombination regulator RecX [Paraburkholderia sp.]